MNRAMLVRKTETRSAPRTSPSNVTQADPFSGLDLDQFAELEMDLREALLDRLNRLWNDGILSGNEEGTDA